MELVVIALVVVVALAVVVWLVTQRSQSTEASALGAGPAAEAAGDFDRFRPPYRDFHVRGDDALVYFDVPLGQGDVDDVLRDLLVREAVEVVREKRGQLPIGDVTAVRAFARRGDADVEVGSVSLETPGELPVYEPAQVAPRFSSAPFDPLAHLGEQEFDVTPEVAAKPADEGLRSLGEEIRLTAPLEAGLRAQGVDPAGMTASDLALGLLRVAGYTVASTDRANTYIASRAGSRTYLSIVDHAPGDYPELSEKAINEFTFGFAGSNTDRGMLITEKFSPYLVYEKERREPRTKFITRERLQAFVDSFSMK